MTTRPPLPAPAQDLIGRRYSCRTYLEQPIADDDQRRLLDFMATRTAGPLGSQARFGLLAAAPGDRQVLRRLGTYGFIKGATGFIVGAVRRAPHDLEDYGYLLEEIVLFATGMGLGTCWLGGTFTRSTFVRRFGGLGRDETMPAVLSLGHIGDDGRGRIREREEGGRRLPAGELFFAGRYGAAVAGRERGPLRRRARGRAHGAVGDQQAAVAHRARRRRRRRRLRLAAATAPVATGTSSCGAPKGTARAAPCSGRCASPTCSASTSASPCATSRSSRGSPVSTDVGSSTTRGWTCRRASSTRRRGARRAERPFPAVLRFTAALTIMADAVAGGHMIHDIGFINRRSPARSRSSPCATTSSAG